MGSTDPAAPPGPGAAGVAPAPGGRGPERDGVGASGTGKRRSPGVAREGGQRRRAGPGEEDAAGRGADPDVSRSRLPRSDRAPSGADDPRRVRAVDAYAAEIARPIAISASPARKKT